MIQNADPTGETASDPPELNTLEGDYLLSRSYRSKFISVQYKW